VTAKRLAESVTRVPPLNRPAVRRQLVRTVWGVRRRRRRMFEAAGSARYSRPALHDLDRRLEPYLADSGTFVEAGAGDGYRLSNTYFLERWRDWSGVLVEPIPELAEACRRERPRSQVFSCALVSPEDAGETVELHYADLMSGIAGSTRAGEPVEATSLTWYPPARVSAPTRTLSEVLGEAGVQEVDFLSLDVEGYEANVLRGLDFTRHTPRLMLIELADFERQRRLVEAEFGAPYELVGALSPIDALYRLSE
jgi:FkbM family methyltransferase